MKSPVLHARKHFLKRKRNYSHLPVSGNFFLSVLYEYLFSKKLFYNDPEFIPEGKILDYGTGAGDAVDFFQYLGWKSEGIEISEQAVANAFKHNLNVRCGSSEQLNGYEDYYDIIYSCHAIEHIAEVDELFKKIFISLKPNGEFVFEVPNGYASNIDTYKDFFYYFGMPVHINLFTPESIRKALAEQGFINIQTETYSAWKFQISSFYTRLFYRKKSKKRNLNSHTKIQHIIGYLLTFIPYLKSLKKNRGDILIVIAQKPIK
jgi:2-polyprenyl-3-methyl-5-hydroxy-6-metoxy-1,4-benzoquinol methylase